MSVFELKFWSDLTPQEHEQFKSSALGQMYSNHYMRNRSAMAYFSDYLGPDFSDRSIFLLQKSVPVLAAPALCREGELNYANGPTEILSVLSGSAHRYAVKMLFKQLKQQHIIANFLIDQILLREGFSHIEKASFSYVGLVDLTLNEKARHQCIRKSYKSLLNWGEKNLNIELIDKSNMSRASFMLFKDLHFLASGRKTRSDKSWDYQFDMIVEGNAYLVNAYLGERLVSGCYILHDNQTALYGVAANDRELMAEGLAINHYPLWQAINMANEKKCKKFLLGNVGIEDQTDQKSRNIAKFKRGFATDIATEAHVTMNFGGTQ